MFRWLKRHFVPHAGNNHRPHFLRRKTLKRVVGLLIVIELVLFVLPTFNFADYARNFNLGSVLPGVLSTLSNEERGKKSLPELSINPLLERAAKLKAEDMATKSYFAHNSPEGLTPWYWFEIVGYNYNFAGENLAVNFTDSYKVTEAWMRSPTHEANIINRNYTEIGTGMATGIYKGKEAVFVAQLYASPKTNPVVVNVPNVSQNLEQAQPSQTSPNVPNQNVLGETTDVKTPNQFSRLMTSPLEAMNTLLLVVLIVVVAALVLNLIIKFEHNHPELTWNGVLVCLLITLLYFGNSYFAGNKIETSFVDFSSAKELSVR